MKLTFYSLAMLALLPIKAFSQNNVCNCRENLRQLVAKTEENYAGFPEKTSGAKEPLHRELVSSLEEKASAETNPKNCFYLLKEYIRFFQDKHFSLIYANPADFDKDIIPYSAESFKEEYKNKPLSAVEGIWMDPDSSLLLAIKKFDNVFKAIVVDSKDPNIPMGLVKFTLTPVKNGFIAKEYDYFNTTDIPAKQKGNLLQIWNFSLFGKVYPSEMAPAEKSELNTWKNNNNGLDFKQLSPKTAYLKIPTFLNNDDKIQQLVAQSDSIIRACDNLIVDLTGNGGGNTGWVAFLPYFMTNPIVQYESMLRVTPENVNAKLADLEYFAVNPIPDEYKKYFPDHILAAYKKAYQELPTTSKPFYPIPGVTFPLDSVMAKPKKIALLVDDFCGSSSEYFFFLVEQSKKTTTYGINTIGMMDYEGMSIPTPLPYDKYILSIPISKSSWTDANPIDLTGFQPEILLDSIEQKNWVQFVLEDLEKQ